MKKSVLLVYSGGLDSTSALYIYKDTIGLAVSFNYGSKHNAREILKAEFNCHKLGIKHLVIDVKEVFKGIKSALLGSEAIPHGHYEADNMKSTVVPFRNGILLSMAAGIAESNGLSQIMLASHRGDNAQYPDCTPTFNHWMSGAVYAGTDKKVSVVTPFAELDKREIAVSGLVSGMVPGDTYSCYEGEEEHCGRCGTCVERIWALNGIKDSTTYKDKSFAIEILKKSGEIQ